MAERKAQTATINGDNGPGLNKRYSIGEMSIFFINILSKCRNLKGEAVMVYAQYCYKVQRLYECTFCGVHVPCIYSHAR